MDKNTDVTILVNSCDLYEDVWEPFFRLLKIQWPECEQYRIVLNTETKKYDCDFLDVETVCGGNVPWSKRLKNVLEKIETKHIVYLLEDFFLMSPVNISSFNRALNLIKNDDNVGYIGLKYNKEYKFRVESKKSLEQPFLNKDDLVTVNRINSMSALWNKAWLESLIRVHETPWEFEKYGSVRSRRTNKKVLIINNCVCPPIFDYQVDYIYGYGITLRKWLPKNKELFDKYNISVNFDNLGMMDPKTYNGLLTYNPNIPKPKEKVKGIKENLYILKKRVFQIPNRIKKLIRKAKSLI